MDEECYSAFGTPLPSISGDDPIRKKPLRVEEQIATDENGLRRFHGAFTGGFSAGFYNTAGSRDGWAPKSFKSSRKKPNQDTFSQKPDDFMDEDDRGGFGFAPQGLKTNSAFESHSRKRDFASSFQEHNQSIPGEPVFQQIFTSVKDSIGVSLLKGMGWKEGKGIGPKLRKDKKNKLKKAIQRIQPQGLHHSQESDEDDDDSFNTKYKDFLFSPDDIPQSVAQPKSNSFGIGYKGLGGTHHFLMGPLTTTSSAVKFRTKSGSKGSIKGQAFGVGIYEEEDADIYGNTNMSEYDFSLSVENESPEKKSRSRKSRWTTDPNVDATIDGFLQASCTSFVLSRTIYKPPQLPKGFKPHIFKKSRFEPESRPIKNPNPTPSDRNTIISTQQEIEVREKQEKEISESAVNEINKLIESYSKPSELKGEFCPFPDDIPKQKRYEEYLICAKHNKRTLGLKVIQRRTSMSEAEKMKEMFDFQRVESLFKPLVSSMAAKFVSANQNDTNDTKNKISLQLEHAVSTKTYGKLTREKVIWNPAPLLCVRFNVKNPYLGKELQSNTGSHSGRNNIFAHVLEMEDKKYTDSRGEGGQSKELKVITDKSSLESKSITTSKLEVNNMVEECVKEKPSIDLFKSIFLDSSDESEGEEKEEVENPKKSDEKVKEQSQHKFKKSSSSKTATGVFAGIDLDSLIAGPSLKPIIAPTQPVPQETKKTKVNEEIEPDSFGPAKPPSSTLNISKAQSKLYDNVDDLNDWGEKGKEERSHSKKKSKKKKLSKKKSTKKKKRKSSKSKKKKKYYTSSSSSSSDSD
ncbi:G patch domain-containing protein 1 homolog [Lepeophtheirus salmonis]|uniref:G patch domain-containing protein 1 homolog n=1 Tax=Lepeophtheirus salmonis TaxID=72036 RepID=UPI001AE31A38|nr:G patch domain-containing protein 1 homolog [Lepeophtheirus salmonis]